MPVSPARDAALDILLRVEQGGFASELLHSERLDRLSAQDRALTTELVMGVQRWRSRLDEGLASLSSQKLSKLDPEVLESLRLAAYQIGFLGRIPAHAAVNDAVELVKRKKKKSAAPFVNAVLRKLLAKKEVLEPLRADEPKTIRELPARYAHPQWLVERWGVLYGFDRVEKVCAYNQQVPPTAIHLSDPAVENELTSAGIELSPGSLLRSARVVIHGDVSKTKPFSEGRVQIQDEGSQLIALLTGRGERLLDCCAAPGGKTAILSERNPSSHILAAELHQHRAEALRERLGRRANVEVATADAAKLEAPGDFDRILADVPCSGTGTLARNPEIKWRLTPEDLNDLHARQVAILRGALSKLRPGGRLVYSTCSLEPEENENVLGEVLSDRAYRVLKVSDELATLRDESQLSISNVESLTDGPLIRFRSDRPFMYILPGAFSTDGFFAAILTRS